MAKSMDKPELETLDKRPSIRVNKADNASQPTEQPKCKTCKGAGFVCKHGKYQVGHESYNKMHIPCPDCSPEQPNTNAMLVKTIQGLMTCVNNSLGKLNENTKFLSCHRNSLVLQALEDIDLFEKTTLFELQRDFE